MLAQPAAQLRGALGRRRPTARRSLHLGGLHRGGEQRLQVEVAQRLQARVMSQVEVQRRHRDPPRRDRREVAAGLVVETGVLAIDPVAPAQRRPRLLALELQLVAVDALAQTRDLDARGLPRGDVDVQQRALGQRQDLQALHQPRDEARREIEVKAAVVAVVQGATARLLGDRDTGDAEHDALERRRDGARIGDVIAEVGAVVDARDHQGRLEVGYTGRHGRA